MGNRFPRPFPATEPLPLLALGHLFVLNAQAEQVLFPPASPRQVEVRDNTD
jgi:hypothetical protein